MILAMIPSEKTHETRFEARAFSLPRCVLKAIDRFADQHTNWNRSRAVWTLVESALEIERESQEKANV